MDYPRPEGLPELAWLLMTYSLAQEVKRDGIPYRSHRGPCDKTLDGCVLEPPDGAHDRSRGNLPDTPVASTEAEAQEKTQARRAAINEALRAYANGFETRRKQASLEEAIDYAFEQIPDPERPEGMPRVAWSMVRSELNVRVRYAGLDVFANIFRRFKLEHGSTIAVAWALAHALKKTPKKIVRQLLQLLWKGGGGIGL